VAKNVRHRDQQISEFIPDPALPPCELCQFFPVALKSEDLVRRLDCRIAKRKPGPRRQKLERLRHDLSRSRTTTLYLHGEKELFTLSTLKAAIPGVTATNWTLVRDYIFYGLRTTPTPGLGSFFYSVADRFCSRKTMHTIVLPAIADLRHEQSEALAEGRLGRAVAISMCGWWHLATTFALAIWHGRT
jgi:hypothetical protein